MLKFEYYILTVVNIVLRLALPMILVVLLYTCHYIYTAAPDGGIMTGFLSVIAELLSTALASLGILIAGAAIPNIKLFL
ncbi:MAG: hypothetical protein E7616_06545 [Ruminococcaceae bacterium]|nr:hypothetical protein [Oscillospiraceae bacterium]